MIKLSHDIVGIHFEKILQVSFAGEAQEEHYGEFKRTRNRLVLHLAEQILRCSLIVVLHIENESFTDTWLSETPFTLTLTATINVISNFTESEDDIR